MHYLVIFAGGGLGSIARYIVSRVSANYLINFPLGTLAANVISSILLGIFLGLSAGNLNHPWRNFFVIGFCGGFSTFSTFSNETFELFRVGSYYSAISNIFLNLFLCLIGIGLGIFLGKK